MALEQYRDDGILPEAMVNYLMTLGWAPHGDSEIVPWSTVVSQFRLEEVNHSPAFFDERKLRAFNGEYLRAMGTADFVAACAPWLASDRVPWPAERFDAATFAAIAPLLQTRVTTLAEVPSMVDFLFLAEPDIDEVSWGKAMNPELDSRLALWGRRLMGDVLLEVRAAFDNRKLAGIDKSASLSAEQERKVNLESYSKIEPLISEMIAAHSLRMDSIGLAA